MKKRTLSPEAKAKKNAYDKEWRLKNKERVGEYKKEHDKKYYQENREKILQQQRQHYKDNPERRKRRNTPEYDKEYRLGHTKEAKAHQKKNSHYRRKEVLIFLGGKCEKCGIDDWRVLQIDHINGGGGKERASGCNFSKIRQDVFEHGREKYQVLCANCHMLKHFEERHGDEQDL